MSRTTKTVAALTRPLTPNQLAEILRLPRHEVQSLLSGMKKRGLVERVDERGAGKGAIYALATKDRPPRKSTCPTTVWDDELTARAIKLNNEGLAASEMARLLGHGLSRNAVIGRLHRLGEVRPYKRTAQAAKDYGMVKRIQTARKAAKLPPTPKASTPPPEAVKPLSEAPAGGVGLLQLTHRTCKWPISNPGPGYADEMLFCGCAPVLGFPYCIVHKAASIQVRTGGGKFRLDRLSVLR